MSGLITAGSMSRADSPFLMHSSAFKLPGCWDYLWFIKHFLSIPTPLPYNGYQWW